MQRIKVGVVKLYSIWLQTKHRHRNWGALGACAPPLVPSFYKVLYKLLTTLCVVSNCPPQSKSLSYAYELTTKWSTMGMFTCIIWGRWSHKAPAGKNNHTYILTSTSYHVKVKFIVSAVRKHRPSQRGSNYHACAVQSEARTGNNYVSKKR